MQVNIKVCQLHVTDNTVSNIIYKGRDKVKTLSSWPRSRADARDKETRFFIQDQEQDQQ